jgi:hypothetical protein
MHKIQKPSDSERWNYVYHICIFTSQQKDFPYIEEKAQSGVRMDGWTDDLETDLYKGMNLGADRYVLERKVNEREQYVGPNTYVHPYSLVLIRRISYLM